jgi:GNAT superfamily N-acetyltransferase
MWRSNLPNSFDKRMLSPRQQNVFALLNSEDIERARNLCAGAQLYCGERSFLNAPHYQPDPKEFETCFAIGERELQAVAVVKRSHFSWDVWGIRLLAVDSEGAQKDALLAKLLDSVKNHIRCHSSAEGAIIALTTETPETFAALGWRPLVLHRGPAARAVMLFDLDSHLEMLPQSAPPAEEISSARTQVSLRTLSEAEIVEARSLAEEAWDRESGEQFAEENIRFLREGAIVCGAFLGTQVVGASTIHRTCFDQDLWGLAWGVVQANARSQGIGSAMTQFRLVSAAAQSPDGSAIIVTSRPEHAVKNGFLPSARYGRENQKWILVRELQKPTP